MARKGGKDRGIYERTPGVWWARFYDADGRDHHRKGGSKSEAKALYERFKTEVRQEKFFPEAAAAKKRRKYLVADAIDAYLEYSRGAKRSWKEDVRHGNAWKKVFAGVPMEKVRSSDIEAWVGSRRKAGIAEGTINRGLAFLKHLFNRAIRDGKATQNPVLSVKMAPENNHRLRFLLDDEEDLLKTAVLPVDWAIIEVAFKTGMRRSEQFLLLRTSVDLKNRIITVPRSKHGERRHIDIGDDVHVILTRILASHKSEYVFPPELLASTDKRGRVFPPGDIRAGMNWIRRVFEKTVERLGFADMTWHTLRHTFVSRLVMAGIDIVTVKELAGHRNIATTMRYAHLSPGHRRAAVQVLNRRPSKPEPEP